LKKPTEKSFISGIFQSVGPSSGLRFSACRNPMWAIKEKPEKILNNFALNHFAINLSSLILLR